MRNRLPVPPFWKVWRKDIREAGQAAVLVGLMFTAMLGILALAIDGGNLYLKKRSLQSAADLAALAGAQVLYDITDMNQDAKKNDARKAAEEYAEKNGYPPPSKVQTFVPPREGPFKSNRQYIEVVIQDKSPTFFAGLLGVSEVPVGARAVAKAGRDSSPFAILALKDVAYSIKLSGGTTITITGAGIMSNSTADGNSPAIGQKGGGSCTPENAAHIEGAVSAAGSIEGCYDSEGLYDHVPPYPDPLAAMPPPMFWPCASNNPIPAECDTTGTRYKALNDQGLALKSSGFDQATIDTLNCKVSDTNLDYDPKFTLCPGIYWYGITVQGGSYKLMPGLYIIAGGGLNYTVGSLSGSGIMIYNTSDPTKSGSTPGTIKIATTGSAQIYASHNPQYCDESTGYCWGANVVLFQDRHAASNDDVSITASGDSGLWGTIYAPSSNVTVKGTSSAGVANGQIIAGTVDLGGGGATTVNYLPEWAVTPPGAMLVE